MCPISGVRNGHEVSYYSKGKSYGIDKFARNNAKAQRIDQRLGLDKKKKGKRKLETEEKDPTIKKSKSRKTAASDERSYKKMRSLVWDLTTKLLYNKEIRKKINQHIKEKAEEKYRKATKKYGSRREEKGLMECETDLRNIYRDTMFKAELLPVMKRNSKMIDKYVDSVMHMWKLVTKYGPPSRRNAGKNLCKQLTIGSLYAMCQGMTVSGKVIFDKDVFLIEMMPPMKYLKYYETNESDKKFRKAPKGGRNLIDHDVKEAISQGATEEELCYAAMLRQKEAFAILKKRR